MPKEIKKIVKHFYLHSNYYNHLVLELNLGLLTTLVPNILIYIFHTDKIISKFWIETKLIMYMGVGSKLIGS